MLQPSYPTFTFDLLDYSVYDLAGLLFNALQSVATCTRRVQVI
jgi:hypothetical protein